MYFLNFGVKGLSLKQCAPQYPGLIKNLSTTACFASLKPVSLVMLNIPLCSPKCNATREPQGGKETLFYRARGASARTRDRYLI